MEHDTLRTSEVAAQAGVNVQTLRYYERRGILEAPRRGSSGYRDYPRETVRIVRFIKRAQELGFTLMEIEELLRLRQDQTATCAEVRKAASSKIENIDQKIKSLQSMSRALHLLVKSCRSNGTTRECPILESIEQKDRKGRRS